MLSPRVWRAAALLQTSQCTALLPRGKFPIPRAPSNAVRFPPGAETRIAREDVRMVGAIEADRPRRMIRAAHEFKLLANAVVPCLGGKTGQGNERLDVFGLGNDEIPDHQDRRQRKCDYR